MNATAATQLVDTHANHAARITCPDCHNTKIVDVARYRGAKGPVKAKCRCGCVFALSLKDLRKFYRKKTNLPGSFSRTDTNRTGVMIVKDLAFAGIGFRTEKDHGLEVDDVIGVRFMLDDGKKTELHRTVVVRSVRGRLIGAEFCDSQGFDMDLCYYLVLS